MLLRNDGVLPLEGGLVADDHGRAIVDPNAPARTIAVVGPNADDQHAQLGDWAGSSGQTDWLPEGHPRELTWTVKDGFERLSPAGWTVTHARGADIVALGPNPDGEFFPDGQPRPLAAASAPVDDAQLAEARAAAKDADYVIAVVGDCIDLVGETRSTATLDLLGGQVALLDAIAATGTPYVVVVIASKPPVLPPSAMNANAIIWAGNPGMAGGRAIAELTLGLIEPTGRLPISFAAHVGQQPVFYHQIPGQHGTRYADLTQRPLFAFGEGLSFTNVAYSALKIADPELRQHDTIRATVTVTNTGTRPTLETVQLYVQDVVTPVTWATKELKTYLQVPLAPGESRTIDLELPVAACSIIDAEERRIVDPGEFALLVGPSSRDEDLLRASFTVSA